MTGTKKNASLGKNGVVPPGWGGGGGGGGGGSRAFV